MVAPVIARLTAYMNAMIIARLTGGMNTMIVTRFTACMNAVVIAGLGMIAVATRVGGPAVAGMPITMVTAAVP